MPRMFGTDGVRGLANRDLTAQLALDLGDAAVRVLGDDERSEFESRRRALVGRDTRVSGDFLAAALSAGMSAGGFDVIDAGIIPTPGVAYLTSVLNVEMGAVISDMETPPAETTKLAMTCVATGPIILLYPFVQRYFVKGITIGAVKG